MRRALAVEELEMMLMICMRGRPEQHAFLPEIGELGAGIELQSYGMVGIQSEKDWETCFELHKAVRDRFRGTVAVHGPFIGMEFGHIDHMIREVVNRRLDMTFDAAVSLSATRVVLHSGYKAEYDLFKLQDSWLERSVRFWQGEIQRWAEAGIEVVLENDIDRQPDLLVRLVDEVDHYGLRLCLDTGHQHMFSELGAAEWVRRMGTRLTHVHLHDNDRSGDHHWSIGRGTVDFAAFFGALRQYAPEATISLEVEDSMEVKMSDLRKLAAQFRSG